MICAIASSAVSFPLVGCSRARPISARPMKRAGSRSARRSKCSEKRAWLNHARASAGSLPPIACRRAWRCWRRSRGSSRRLVERRSVRCSTFSLSRLRRMWLLCLASAFWKLDASTWPMVRLSPGSRCGARTTSALPCRLLRWSEPVSTSYFPSTLVAPPKPLVPRSSTLRMPSYSMCRRTLPYWW